MTVDDCSLGAMYLLAPKNHHGLPANRLLQDAGAGPQQCHTQGPRQLRDVGLRQRQQPELLGPRARMISKGSSMIQPYQDPISKKLL